MEQSCARKLRGLEHCLQLELLHLGVGNFVEYNALYMSGHSYKRNKVQLDYCSSGERVKRCRYVTHDKRVVVAVKYVYLYVFKVVE